MHLKTCCALLLLALVACQAAPSPKTEEEPTEAESSKELNIEEADAEEKERAKKSTTLCVEFSSGKEQQVPCNQVQQQPAVLVQEPNQLWYVQQPQQQVPQGQTIVVPGSQPTPQTHFIHLQEQQQQQQQQNLVVPGSPLQSSYSTVQIVQPQPQAQQTVQVAPQPTVQVHTRPTVQVQTRPVQVQNRPSTVQVQTQPSQVQIQSQPTVQVQSQPTTVQVQSQPTVQVKPGQQTLQVQTRPTVQVYQSQPIQQHTHLIQVQTQPQPQPQQQQNTIIVPNTEQEKTQYLVPNYKVESSAPCASEVVIQPQVELITPQVVPQVIQQQPTIIEVPAGYLSDGQSEDELYECSCHPGKQNLKSKYSKLTDILAVYPGASIVANTPLYSSQVGYLPSGQFVSTNQLASNTPIVSSSTSYGPVTTSASYGPVASSASLGSVMSGSASLGSAMSGSASLGSAMSGSGSLGSTLAGSGSYESGMSGSTSFGPASSSTSVGLAAAGGTSFKSPLLQYNLNGGVASAANFGHALTGARHHKHKVPAQLSIQIPVSTANAPAVSYSSKIPSAPVYYSYNSYPSTGTAPFLYNPNTYYENTYATYTNPNAYSNPPENSPQMITVNASGPFYRESANTDNKQDNGSPTTDKPQKATSISPISEESNGNKKRETDLTQMNEATQEQKESNTPIVNVIQT